VVACLPNQDHVYVTTDELLHFHKNELDQMPCKLEFTENPRLILMRILEIYKSTIAPHQVDTFGSISGGANATVAASVAS